MTKKHDEQKLSEDMQIAMQADEFASKMDDVLLNMDELDPEACPPDLRFVQDGREAWVYEHGNVAELVFVKTN